MACLIEGIYFLEQQQKKCHEQVRITSGHNRADARNAFSLAGKVLTRLGKGS
jgi:hypothetical protein